MKKLSTLFMGIALLISGFMFSGCQEGDEITEVLAGPTNTWCKMPVAYKNTDDANANPSNLYAYFYYATSDKTIGHANLKKGLNLVLTTQNQGDSLFGKLTDNTFYIKSFSDGEQNIKDSNDDTESIKVDFSREKWSAIYWAKKDLRENKSSQAPSQVMNGTQGLDFSELQNFSLKRLLAQYLLSILDN